MTVPNFPVSWGTPNSSLLTGLSAFWNCDENGTGDLIDVFGVTNLTARNAPASAAGLINFSRVCDQAGQKNFFLASSSPTNTGAGISFSGSLWFYSTDANKFATRQRFMGNYNSGALGGFSFYMDRPGNTQTLTLQTQAGGVQADLSVATGDTLNAWSWMYFEYDSGTGTKTIKIKCPSLGINLSAGPTAVTAPTANDPSVPFSVGAYHSGVESCLGNIDMVGLWNTRILTLTEQNTLYNGGLGKQFPFQP